MSTATQGRAREHLVRDHMLLNGWHLVARSAGSKGPADLVMVSAEHGLALVQVGTANKHLDPAERARFVELANLCSALALVATVDRGRITYRLADLEPASRWAAWSL